MRQELKQRPWRNDARWLAFPSLLSYLPCAAQDHLCRDGTAHSGLSPHSSVSKENAPQTSPQAKLREITLSLEILSSWGMSRFVSS